MDNIERFGVFLPSYVWKDDGPNRAEGIKDFARHVEDLGFDSIFVTDRVKLGTPTLITVLIAVPLMVWGAIPLLSRIFRSWPQS